MEIRAYLAFSKIERGSARSTVSEVELNQTLESMRERFESRLDTACLRLDFQPTDPLRITLDTSALEHILFNLIDNAAKYGRIGRFLVRWGHHEDF